MFRKILSGRVTRRILMVMSGMCALVVVGLCTYALAVGGSEGQDQSAPSGGAGGGGGGQGGAVVSDDLGEADIAVKARDYKRAAQLYGKAVEAGGPRDKQMHARKGLVVAQICTGKSQEAASGLEELKSGYAGEPGLGAAMCEVADTYDQVHQYKQAHSCYKGVLTDSSSNAEERTVARRGLAWSAISMGRLEEAKDQVEALTSDSAGQPILAQAMYEVGNRYYAVGQYDQAEALYKEVLAGNWDHPIAARTEEGLALVYIRTGLYDRAEQVTDKLQRRHSDDPALASYLRAIAYGWMDIGQRDRAGALYREILSQFPDTAISDQCRAELLQAEVLGALADKKGAKDLDRAVGRLKGADVSKGVVAEAMVRAGKVCRRKGQDQAATELFEKAASGPGKDLSGAQAKALALIGLGRDSDADKAIRSLVNTQAHDPDLAQALLEIGTAIVNSAPARPSADHTGLCEADQAKAERATAVLGRIKDLPIHPAATIQGRLALARTLLSQGELSDARGEFEYILETWPDDASSADASLLLGSCYDRLAARGQMPEAEAIGKKHEVYAALIEARPDCKAAAAMRRSVGQWDGGTVGP